MAVLKILGKLLVSVGLGILLFVAWQLWGTGLAAERAQSDLGRRYDRLPHLTAERPRGSKFAGPPESFRPGPGDPVFRLRIPRIDVDQVVVEGVDVEQLKRGPGHYPNCRPGFDPPLCTRGQEIWPGERGRAIVSGHRTTYGGPFWALDELRRGDELRFDTRWGEFTYEVTAKEVVSPNATDIATPAGNDPEVVLTTCNPRFSAAERLVVFAEMVQRGAA